MSGRHAWISLTCAALLGGCTAPKYDGADFTFTCAADGRCPRDYRCASGYCVRDGRPSPATALDQSSAPIYPEMHHDPDRGGMITCWTRQEDQDSPRGGIYASFLTAEGVARPRIQLAAFDTTRSTMLATCAPVPNSGGKVLAIAYIQHLEQTEIRVTLWSPNDGDLYHGTSTAFYFEAAPFVGGLIPLTLRAAVVGDEVWVAYHYSTSVGIPGVYSVNDFFRLRFSAEDLTRGYPRRDAFASLITDAFRAEVVPTDGGAWFVSGKLWTFTGLLQQRPDPVRIALAYPLPRGEFGAGVPLGARGNELAATWQNPADPMVIGAGLRIAWVRWNEQNVRFGPLLPFTKIATPRPGSFRLGDDLYVIGAPLGEPLQPRPVNVPVNEDTSQMTVEARAKLTLYRVRWGLGDSAGVEVVDTIERPLGDFPVIAAAAQPLLDEDAYGLAWVEYYPRNAVGQGVRYALFQQKHPIF